MSQRCDDDDDDGYEHLDQDAGSVIYTVLSSVIVKVQLAVVHLSTSPCLVGTYLLLPALLQAKDRM